MTPKEKAIELFDKYMGFKMNPYDDIEMTLKKGMAKTNALIAVDEIINIAYWGFMESGGKQEQEYWEEVKQEIEAL
jgi:hypothetical protein